MLSKANYRLNAIPVKTPMAVFIKREKNLQFMWNHKKTPTAKVILRKKDIKKNSKEFQ